MKRIILISVLCIIHIALQGNTKPCEITIQSRWQDLETPRETKLFGSKWILAAEITFKRTPEIKEAIFIDRLQFSWNGPTIFNLHASLFKKTPNKRFLPLEEALLCDGKWNNNTQELYFSFDEEQRLDPITTFYIVVTIPNDIEDLLQQGNFTLINSCLPDELQDPNAMAFALSFTVRPSTTSLIHSRIA